MKLYFSYSQKVNSKPGLNGLPSYPFLATERLWNRE
jgi:hypothetical protein